MKGFVNDLVALVGGRNGNGINSSELGVRSSEAKIQSGNGKKHVGQFINKVTKGVKKKDMMAPVSKLSGQRPEKVIPMGEEDFKQF